MFLPPLTKKGFTLLELMLVVSLIALLSIAALSSMMKSQDQFRFKSVVNESVNALRTIRNYALSNKPTPTGVPTQYGAYIDPANNKIVIFGDTNGNGQYTTTTPKDHTFSTYTIPVNAATYTLFNGDDDEANELATGKKLTILYKPTSADFLITNPEITSRYATIKIKDTKNEDRFVYIVLFKESGNPEVLNTLDDI